MKIIDTYEQFLDYGKSEKLHAPETQKKNRDCFASWILPRMGNLELEKLSRVDMLNFRKELVNAQLSVARQYSLLMCMKTYLKFCRTVLKVKCLDPAEIVLPSKGKPHVKFLKDDEIQKMLDSINLHRFTGLRLRVLIELILATDVRLSEALSLNREIFDRGDREVDIIGKGKKRRTIFLSPRCILWARKFIASRSDDNPALFVTTGSIASRWAREDVSRYFIKLSQDAELGKTITPHILRHTYCTNLLRNGADITFIKDLAGHQDIHTTERYYLGRDTSMLRDVVNKFLNYNFYEEQQIRRLESTGL